SPVSFLWVPQTAGSPDTQANSPGAYYPGDAYVDWVGTDFYSLYPNFSGLQRFYAEYPRKPFVFGEWALWNGDDPGWVSQLFSFIASHPRVHMALYNQAEREDGPFRLSRYPSSRREIKQLIASPRFLAYTPEWQARLRGRRSTTQPARPWASSLAAVTFIAFFSVIGSFGSTTCTPTADGVAACAGPVLPLLPLARGRGTFAFFVFFVFLALDCVGVWVRLPPPSACSEPQGPAWAPFQASTLTTLYFPVGSGIFTMLLMFPFPSAPSWFWYSGG